MKVARERNIFGLTGRDMSTLDTIFRKYPVVQTVFIFGSRAKGNYKLGSDIDLAVMNPGVDEAIVLQIKGELEESTLAYNVDVVNYPALLINDLKEHIEQVGVRFYGK